MTRDGADEGIGPRLLFLDDDPRRAAAFVAENPRAVWVKTVPDCLEELGGAWDEVHLDHDLAGETLVDSGRDDCGMEVVRWLVEEPREHLRGTSFVVHTHNANAACMMALHLEASGYRVRVAPFGRGGRPPGPWARLLSALGLRPGPGGR